MIKSIKTTGYSNKDEIFSAFLFDGRIYQGCLNENGEIDYCRHKAGCTDGNSGDWNNRYFDDSELEAIHQAVCDKFNV